MTAWKWLAVGVLSSSAFAQEPATVVQGAATGKKAASRVTAVTVYQENALVTREVAVPEGKGTVELVVTPLPPAVVPRSLFSEGGDGLRVLNTRYRARAVKEDTRAAVRAKEEEIKRLQNEAQRVRKEMEAAVQDAAFLQKLEAFTGATMQTATEKGKLDGDATIKLSRFVMKSRTEKASAIVGHEQALQAIAEAITFAQRQLQELSAGSSRTEIDAVIVVDKANAPAGTVRLNYLVGAATWKPLYRLRAGGEKDPVSLEYQAAIEQQSGEDWTDASVTLSTALPSLSATLPELLPLEINAVADEVAAVASAGEGPISGGLTVEQNRAYARMYRGKAQQEMDGVDSKVGGALLNQAAALDQAEELLAKGDDAAEARTPSPAGGPSVTHHLAGRLSIPSRREAQLVEVTRFAMTPEFFARAVPVLSPRVYRLAKLTNTGDTVILPGEATMYVGRDFVGRMTLPQVAVGEPFTVGFGVDPQLQIGRRLAKKTQAVQGGNQVQTYEFRIVARNFRSTPVTLQVWDRLPKPESSAVAVSLTEARPELSGDALYNRVIRPDNLLRWDLTVPGGTVGEKALTITYQFRLEYAKEMAVEYLKTGGLMESPIGGMGGMMGGMGMGGMGGGMR